MPTIGRTYRCKIGLGDRHYTYQLIKKSCNGFYCNVRYFKEYKHQSFISEQHILDEMELVLNIELELSLVDTKFNHPPISRALTKK